MSKGTKMYSFRLDADLVRAVQEAIDRRFLTTSTAPWTLSDYVRTAIAEKLAKAVRSNRKKPKGGKGGRGVLRDLTREITTR